MVTVRQVSCCGPDVTSGEEDLTCGESELTCGEEELPAPGGFVVPDVDGLRFEVRTVHLHLGSEDLGLAKQPIVLVVGVVDTQRNAPLKK